MTNTRNLFGAIMLAISLFFVSPAVVGGWQKTQALRAAKNERETLLADRKKILGPIITEYAKYQKMTSQGNGKLFVQLVPVSKSTPELISAIQDMANISGVQVLEVQINASDDTKDTSYGTISLELNLVAIINGVIKNSFLELTSYPSSNIFSTNSLLSFIHA